MGANSKIEWCDHTFNPWIGCTRVSPGCDNCYAESENNRRLWATQGWGPGKPRHRTSAANWNKVKVWNEQAKGAAQRPRVFSASLADWLDDEVPITWLAELLLLIRDTPNLDWLLLTKRPQNFHFRMEEILNSDFSGAATSPASVRRPSRIMEIFNPDLSEALRDLPGQWLDGRPPKNVWFGVSTEDQKRADSRIPFLFSIPASVRWLSVEPLIEPLDLSSHLNPLKLLVPIDWVVVGGESGTYARPCHPEWVRSLRDECRRRDVPFFFKQWGEFAPNGTRDESSTFRLPSENVFADGQSMLRVGKKQAGLLIDGEEWKQFPEVKA